MPKIEKLFFQPFEIDIHYKKIKNIYLRVNLNGKLEISAPLGTPKAHLIQFVKSRSSWINEKQQNMAERRASSLALEKDEILLFGKPYTGSLSAEELQNLLHEKITFYCHKYWPFFKERGCAPFEIKYRMMKSTWGVCRPIVGTITFNKRLVSQPEQFIEYVVLHEMCHLLIPDHSKEFYQLVAHHLPEFKQYEKTACLLSNDVL